MRHPSFSCFELFPTQVYQETTGVEHIPVVQIDLTVPLKVPGESFIPSQLNPF